MHSLSGISLAQLGRYDEAMAALRQAERLAAIVHADDVLATVCGNQANVMMLQHRYEQALALAERSVALHEAHGSGHGLAVALATLGQICVRLGDLGRAEDALHRALDVRSPIQFHETTGAVFDTLAQIHLMRGRYDTASEFLGRASEAYGAYGRQTSQLVRVVGARARRAPRAAARRRSTKRWRAPTRSSQAGAPPFDALQATLIAAEALIAAGRLDEAEQRLAAAADALDPRVAPATWGEYLRLRGALHAQVRQRRRRVSRLRAERDAARSARRTLPGRRSAISRSAAWSAETGARSVAERHLEQGARASSSSSAPSATSRTRAPRSRC